MNCSPRTEELNTFTRFPFISMPSKEAERQSASGLRLLWIFNVHHQGKHWRPFLLVWQLKMIRETGHVFSSLSLLSVWLCFYQSPGVLLCWLGVSLGTIVVMLGAISKDLGIVNFNGFNTCLSLGFIFLNILM